MCTEAHGVWGFPQYTPMEGGSAGHAPMQHLPAQYGGEYGGDGMLSMMPPPKPFVQRRVSTGYLGVQPQQQQQPQKASPLVRLGTALQFEIEHQEQLAHEKAVLQQN